MKRLFIISFGLSLMLTDIVLLLGAFAIGYNLRLRMEPRAQITMPALEAYQGIALLIVVSV
ncbi:MAG TPA: hypothetical protein VHS06_09540, partial [Chloroflexota bacterium]|nr:hypothetical protein [Chloroflexota bacterium]